MDESVPSAVNLFNFLQFKQLSLPQLLKKTAFLVAVVYYKRPADLYNMQIVQDYWVTMCRGLQIAILRRRIPWRFSV